MKIDFLTHLAAVTVLAVSAALPQACSQEAQSGAGRDESGVVVLDTCGFWRMHHTLKPPMIAHEDGPGVMDLRWRHPRDGRVLRTYDWLRRETPPPPPEWMEPDFDDGTWMRGPARTSARTPMLARLRLRGYFEATDPAQVGDLLLSIGYRGGALVYLNGREVARLHLPDGEDAGEGLLAEGYPPEAFTPDNGWDGDGSARNPREETAEEIELRERHAEVAIPSEFLRTGRNVLAIDIIRSPYHRVVEENKGRLGARYVGYYLAFNTCQIDRVRLTTARDAGLEPNAVRGEGFEVWNNDVLAGDYNLDFGGAEPLRPIRIAGARNGRFSGKVVAGAAEPIRDLSAVVTDLESGEGTIPAGSVRIRYGIPWGSEYGIRHGRTLFYHLPSLYASYPLEPVMLGALEEEPPQEFPVRPSVSGRNDFTEPGQPDPVFGAVVPLWVTVHVPADAPPGTYHGRLDIAAQGQETVSVPVELQVADWTLPDPPDYRTWMELIQSPDTLALEYEVPLWSDEHFDLIARSLRLMHEAGVQIVSIPLIAQTNHGNAETMVRWLPAEDGEYRFDFSIMERYLDLAERYQGRPKVVCFIAWDSYLGADTGYKDSWGHNQRYVDARMEFVGKGPMVTLLDQDTGETEEAFLPPFTEPAAADAWRAMFDELRARMRERGLEDTMMIGLMSDVWPSQEERVFYDDVTGGLPWVSHSHLPVTDDGRVEDELVTAGVATHGGLEVDRSGFRIGYHSSVLGTSFADTDPPLGSLQGWNRADLSAYQPRYESGQPASSWRHLMEVNITGLHRGVGRGGADYWPLEDRRGRRNHRAFSRYVHSLWRNLNIPWSMFAPGSSGPVATGAFEALREGIQECQARIVIEEAVLDEELRSRLGDDLARRCEELLVERTHLALKAYTNQQLGAYGQVVTRALERRPGIAGHRWFVGSGWQERTAQLYNLAGEVQRALDGPAGQEP